MINWDLNTILPLMNNFIFYFIWDSFHPKAHLIMFEETLSNRVIHLDQNWLKLEFRNLTMKKIKENCF